MADSDPVRGHPGAPDPVASDGGAPDPDPAIGSRVGRYTLLARLARGGMAEIFLAEAADLPGVRRRVVLKQMLPEIARDPRAAAMFLDEARILAGLSHPNVVQVVEVGREAGELYIAMEHVDGLSLAAVAGECEARGELLPLPHAVHVLDGVLAGLHYVHERRDDEGRSLQLIHRDVTPRNVLITWEGGVKLIDFGIARSSSQMGATGAGRVKGTAPYMSPEQCRGRLLDRRTDVFSAGILLWELTVGRPLFRGDSEFDTLREIVDGTVPSPGALVAGYSPALEAVVMRALAKAPAERYQTAGELLDALDQVSRGLGLRPSPRSLHGWLVERFAGRIAAARDLRERLRPEAASGAVTGARDAETVDSPIEAVPGDPPDAPPAPPPRSAVPPSDRQERQPRDRRRRGILGGLGLASATLLGVGLWLAVRGPAPSVARIPATPDRAPIAAAPIAAAVPTGVLAPVDAAPSAIAAVRPAAPPDQPPAPTRAGGSHPDAPPRRNPRQVEHPSDGNATPGDGEPRIGELVVESRPWCEVSVDGKDRGATPLLLRLEAGPHRVELRNAEFGIARTATVTVEPGRSVRRRFDFPDAGAN